MKEQEAKERIEKAGGCWLTFCKWMYGQTMGIYPDGSCNIYKHDVDRFISHKCDPKNESLHEWD